MVPGLGLPPRLLGQGTALNLDVKLQAAATECEEAGQQARENSTLHTCTST